jgi:type VI secretion system ImpM family protein
MEAVRNEKTALPAAPTGFILAPAGCKAIFVGAFAPSTDAAGRLFPLAAFATLTGAGSAETLPTLAAAYAPFIEAARALTAAGAELSGPELVARAQELAGHLPARGAGTGAAVGFEADGGATALAHETAQPLATALGGSRAAVGYALRTFTMACDQAAKTGPAGNGGVITVDAPAPDQATRTLWLELARRRLKWRDAAPSLLWTNDAPGRLLITLGWPSPAALSFLANPRHRAPRFWPLRTDVLSAIDQAMKALTPEQRRRVENPGGTLAELISSFS